MHPRPVSDIGAPMARSAHPTKPSAKNCPRCQALQAELAAAKSERDAALAKAAETLEALDAYRVSFATLGLKPDPAFAQGETSIPLRYRLVDRANDELKRLMGPAHHALREAVDVWKARGK